MIAAATTGFLTSFALILAIGAQNAFVLRQGILRQHVFAVALTCALSDAILISAGVAGFGTVTALFPALPTLMRFGGAGFLLGYGILRFRDAWRGASHLAMQETTRGLRGALITCLALTWLNPHVYLDTLGLIGAVSTGFSSVNEKTFFTIGAVSASFIFFFSLGYGATLISNYMNSPRAWRIMDAGIGVLMWALATGLILDGVL